MINNIQTDEHVVPNAGVKTCEEWMNHVNYKKYLEIGNKQLTNPYGTNPYSVDYKKATGTDELCKLIKDYAENFTRLKPSTITRDLNYIRGMANQNQPFPINFLQPNYTQYIYHMTWYKEHNYDPQTGKNYYGLKQKKEAFELYLKACGIPKHYFAYDLPKSPDEKPIEFPNPDIAFEITRYPYFKDKEENWLYQIIHTYNLIIGPRPPSETALLTLDMIDWDNNSITFPQPKRNGKQRKVYIEEAFMKGKTRKSLKNYIDHHRDTFTTQHSKNYLFVSPKTGKPFTDRFLGKQLSHTGKMVYPKWYPYMARHFCATGRLIEAYLDKDPDPIKLVQDYMDHDSRKNTEKYTKHARAFYKNFGYNWFKRILRNKNKYCWGKYAEKSKQRQNTHVSTKIPSREWYSPEQMRTTSLPLIKTKLISFLLVSISLTKNLFSFFIKKHQSDCNTKTFLIFEKYLGQNHVLPSPSVCVKQHVLVSITNSIAESWENTSFCKNKYSLLIKSGIVHPNSLTPLKGNPSSPISFSWGWNNN